MDRGVRTEAVGWLNPDPKTALKLNADIRDGRQEADSLCRVMGSSGDSEKPLYEEVGAELGKGLSSEQFKTQ